MSKRRIAVLISLLLAAPAAVVVAQSASESTATEPPQELQSAAEPVTTTEVVAVEQTTVAIGIAPVEPAPTAEVPSATGNWRGTVASSAFPQGSTNSDDSFHYHLPRQLAYLERLEQQRGTMIALGSSFPAGTSGEDVYQHLPRQMAFFNQRDQQRLAASIPAQQPMASTEVQARSGEESAQAGSAELAMSSVR